MSISRAVTVAAIEPEEPHAGIQAPDLEGAWP